MMLSDKVKQTISRTLNIDAKLIPDNLAIGDIPEWDSVGNLAIINAIEENFEVEIPLEDLFELNSVQSFVKWLENNR